MCFKHSRYHFEFIRAICVHPQPMYNIEDKHGLYSFHLTALPWAIYTPIYCPYSLVYRVNKVFRYTLGKTFQVIHLLDVLPILYTSISYNTITFVNYKISSLMAFIKILQHFFKEDKL